jgi:hypothetical protein
LRSEGKVGRNTRWRYGCSRSCVNEEGCEKGSRGVW